MFWDPYDRYNRDQRRRLAEQEAARRAQAEAELRRRAQAEQEMRSQQQSPPPDVIVRFAEELAEARRERDAWADRYDQLMGSLNEQRDALEAEREQMREQARSEATAQRERLQRNAEQRAFEETRKVLQRMLDVSDNLDRAVAQLADGEQGGVAEGVRLTHREFQRALEQAGVERLQSIGVPFNPELHEAVASAPAEVASGTILQEVAPGYVYRGALLRPAKVVVAN